ncbi:MAG: aldose epimerase family protein [Spirochaetia bacterium]
MTIGKEAFGHCPEGPVERITIENANGLAVSAITYGATLISVLVPDSTGTREEVTLGFDSLEGYLGKHPYFGATVGRVANRVSNGAFKLNGRTYKLDRNEGGHTLHGGSEGFNRKLWNAELAGEANEASVVFSRTSPDGEAGFPGNLAVSVRLSLSEQNELTLTYEATTDQATPINLTNHSYWNLSAQPSRTIREHIVRIDPGHYLPTGEGQIPTGDVASVDGDPHDFRTKKAVGADIEDVPGGYDVCYLYGDELDSAAVMASDSLRRIVEVEDPTSGRTMEVHTTLPGVQFYSGNKLSGAPARAGGTLPKHAGMCFETQFLPNAINEPAFPSPILRPGEKLSHKTVHVFSNG